jgi:hypothetical protein
MRLRHTLSIINWTAAAAAIAVFVIGKEKDYAWLGIIVLAAAGLHFLIETVVLLRRGRFQRRLADVQEYKENRPFLVKDVESALSADTLVAGVMIPVVLSGVVSGAEKKAPLSGRKAVAYKVVAEPIEAMGKIGGQVLVVDSWWGDLVLQDETGSVRLDGPGVLDGSSLKERIFTLKNLRSEMPEIASRVEDGLGIKEGKESKSSRIALREIALFPADKVRVYGKADRSSGTLGITGTDALDDPGSLLVRAAGSPASSRLPRRALQTIAFAAVTVLLFAGMMLLAASTVLPQMFVPGGLFDSSRTGYVNLDLDGRPLRVAIGSDHWDLSQGQVTRGFRLATESISIKSGRAGRVLIESVTGTPVMIVNGDPDFPRWDGAAWVFDAGPGRLPDQAENADAAAHAGWLYIRNMTGSPVTLRVLKPDGSAMADTTWTFAAYEAADEPRGHYLQLRGKGALQVDGTDSIELTTKKGFRRVLRLSRVATWGTSWLFEIVPERLAGSGRIYVKNSGDSPVNIWLLGSDGATLYGEEPWTFEPREGMEENKGLRLTYEDKDIIMTGRESVRLEARQLTTIYDGPLERIGSWHRGEWTIDMKKAAP